MPKLRRLLWWIPLIVVGLAIVYGAGWTLYFQHKLGPILAEPAARLAPTPFKLAPAGPIRTVDLGYVTFSLPATVAGPVVRAGRTGFVCIGSPSAASPLRSAVVTACPPQFEKQEEKRALLVEYNRNSGAPAGSYFDWQVRTLTTEPFSAWDIWRIGMKEAANRAMLLSLKGLRLYGATSFSVGRAGEVGYILVNKPTAILLTVEDRKAGVGQLFMIQPSAQDAPEVISTIIRTYRPEPGATSTAQAMHLLDAAHLKTGTVGSQQPAATTRSSAR